MVWAAVGIAAVGTVSSIAGGISADKKAKSAAKHQAKLTHAQRMEEIRMKVRAAQQQKGTAVAAVHSSNIQMSGSSQRYVNALDTENMREIAYAKEAARMEKRAIEKGASGAGASLFANAGAQIGQAAGLIAGHYMNAAPPADAGGGFGSLTTTKSSVFSNAAPMAGGK